MIPVPDIDTRTDIVLAAHVVAEAIGSVSADYGYAIEQRFFDAGELPTLGKSIQHLERLLKHARRMKCLPKRKRDGSCAGLAS